MLGVPGGVVAVQPSPVPEVDAAHVVQRDDPVRGDRRQLPEKPVERGSVHRAGAGHQAARVGEVPCALDVHYDLRARVHGRDVAGAARVVEVDVRDHDRGQVRRSDPQGGERGPHYRRGRRGACFHEARPAAPDQVPGRYACVPGHPGVDLEDIAAEVGNVTIWIFSVAPSNVVTHPTIVPD